MPKGGPNGTETSLMTVDVTPTTGTSHGLSGKEITVLIRSPLIEGEGNIPQLQPIEDSLAASVPVARAPFSPRKGP